MSSSERVLRIAIDGNEANVSNRVGSNVYAFEVMKQLEMQTRERSDIEWTVLLASPAAHDLPKARPGWRYKLITPRKFWTQWALPIYLARHRNKLDLFFTPGHYAPRFSAVPYVSSVMDLAFLKFPEQFRLNDRLQLTHWTKYSALNARHLITISEFSARDIQKTYNLSKTKLTVAFPGVSEAEKLPSQTRQVAQLKKSGIKNPYFLYVGTLQPRKNIPRLVTAFEIFCQNHPDQEFQLVLAGKAGWLTASTLNRVAQSPYTKQILTLGYVRDQLKHILYRHALATVQVGLYEGFGMPPLEAYEYGTPAVVADNSSLPEAVGPTGILVDPYNPVSIAQGLEKAREIITEPNSTHRAQFRKAARQQHQLFTWKKTGASILKTLIEEASKTKDKS